MKKSMAIAAAFTLFSTGFVWAADANKGKESYLKKAESEVQEWTAKLKSLQERSEKSGTSTRQELDQRIKVVDEKLAVANKKLDDLRASSEGTWKSLRRGLEDALRDVKRAVRNAQSFFNKKEAKEGST